MSDLKIDNRNNQTYSNIDYLNGFIKIKSEIKNSENQSYNDFKSSLKINFKLVNILMLLPFVSLIFFIFLSFNLELIFSGNFFINIIFVVINSAFIGLIFHNIQNIIHAGIHFNLHSDKKINDKVSNFLGLFTATEISQVRKIHQLHHTKNGSLDDPEGSYLKELNVKKFIGYFTGYEIFKYLLTIEKKIEESNKDKTTLIKKLLYIVNLQRILSLFLHLSVLYFFYFELKSIILSLSWIYAFFGFLPFYNSLQNILEHSEHKVTKQVNKNRTIPVNRNFSSGFISKYVFGNFGSNKHAIHHWDPSIHFLNLENTETFLEDTQIKNVIKQKKSDYLKTLKNVLL